MSTTLLISLLTREDSKIKYIFYSLVFGTYKAFSSSRNFYNVNKKVTTIWDNRLNLQMVEDPNRKKLITGKKAQIF